jgi:hypothetical protein
MRALLGVAPRLTERWASVHDTTVAGQLRASQAATGGTPLAEGDGEVGVGPGVQAVTPIRSWSARTGLRGDRRRRGAVRRLIQEGYVGSRDPLTMSGVSSRILAKELTLARPSTAARLYWVPLEVSTTSATGILNARPTRSRWLSPASPSPGWLLRRSTLTVQPWPPRESSSGPPMKRSSGKRRRCASRTRPSSRAGGSLR